MPMRAITDTNKYPIYATIADTMLIKRYTVSPSIMPRITNTIIAAIKNIPKTMLFRYCKFVDAMLKSSLFVFIFN